MKYLAIDTSSKNLTVILNDGKNLLKIDEFSDVRHSETLMPSIESLVESSNVSISDLDFIAVIVGAGSFTGIRIGIATIKALCFAFNKPCLSITSFDTLAYNKKGEKVLAVIDAKHNGFYVCGYDNKKVVLEPCYIMRDKLDEIKGEYQRLVAVKPIDGLDICPVSVEKGLEIAVREKSGEISCDLESLVPLYCRKSQAEEGR